MQANLGTQWTLPFTRTHRSGTLNVFKSLLDAPLGSIPSAIPNDFSIQPDSPANKIGHLGFTEDPHRGPKS